jgi:hypothetical protein
MIEIWDVYSFWFQHSTISNYSLFCLILIRYAELGIFSVLSVGILTLFYSGLLDLAKVFLDPLDNEDYREGCVYIDLAVLIRESNSASTRWMNAAEKVVK